MATLTLSQEADLALEVMGVKAVTQNSSSADNAAAQKAVNAVYLSERRNGLCPFASTAFPEWAQYPVAYMAAVLLSGTYGISGDSLQKIMALAAGGRGQLVEQMRGKIHPVPVKMEYF